MKTRERQGMECGGKRSATPLWLETVAFRQRFQRMFRPQGGTKSMKSLFPKHSTPFPA